MEHNELLAMPENRQAVKDISLQAVSKFVPSELATSRLFVDPLLDLVAQGHTLSAEASDEAMGLGGADLALLIVVPLISQIFGQFLAKWGLNTIDAFRANMKTGQEQLDVPSNREALRHVLANHFDENELHDLVFDLGLEYASLSGETREDKSRELIGYYDRRGQLGELMAQVACRRPHIAWSKQHMSIEIDPRDVQKFTIGTKYARNRKKHEQLVNAISIALQEHLNGTE